MGLLRLEHLYVVTFPLIGPTAAALRAQRTLMLEMRLVAGPAWEDTDFVFPTAIGTPGDQSNVYHQFKKLLRQAGLPHM